MSFMPPTIHWIANSQASHLYAAAAMIANRPLVDVALFESLREVVSELQHELAGGSLERDTFFSLAIPLAQHAVAPRDLAQTVCKKWLGPTFIESIMSRLAVALAELFHAGDRAQPKLADELKLRGGPLREQWETYGPGLLAGIARRIEPELFVERANVLLVQPISGGGGTAYPQTNSVAFEAVLTNAQPQLPEVLRLAWLLAQLNLDLPRYSERLEASRRDRVLRLSILPVVLETAADLELTTYSPDRLAQAALAWGAPLFEPLTPAVLDTWWQTYRSTCPPWPIALEALDALCVTTI